LLGGIFKPSLRPPDIGVVSIETLVSIENPRVETHLCLFELRSQYLANLTVTLREGEHTPAGKKCPSNSQPPSGTVLTRGIPTTGCSLMLSFKNAVKYGKWSLISLNFGGLLSLPSFLALSISSCARSWQFWLTIKLMSVLIVIAVAAISAGGFFLETPFSYFVA
jgi:hypothetical protein